MTYRQRTFEINDTAGQLQALHDDGFALIPGVLNANEVAAARDAINNLTPFGFDAQGPTDHYKCVFNRDPFWLRFLDKSGVIELAESAMGEECHIIGQSAWRSHPAHNGWAPHTDRVFFEVPEELLLNGSVKLPIYLCTAHFYLSDITEELCPTYVIPGSHKSGRALTWGKDPSPTWNGRELEPVLCKAGDVLFFRSEIWHSGSQNKTAEETRYLLQNHYSHRFIAHQFSPYITWQFNPEVLAAANATQLRLLGNHKPSAYD
jgi:ectoine hydroxylase-related dioxygenase (phytanoyl-CoA dioxygenase family)